MTQDTGTVGPVESPPAPWGLIAEYAGGGLRQIGFVPDSDLLLVVSSNGAGLFDCSTGVRLERDYEYELSFSEEVQLTATGIGPVAGQQLRMAGLHGGGLRHMTEDGWKLEVKAERWPNHDIYLDVPFEPRNASRPAPTKVADDDGCELRSHGFSETGRSFVVALSCTLMIFARWLPELQGGQDQMSNSQAVPSAA
jgi:hypothetical protein